MVTKARLQLRPRPRRRRTKNFGLILKDLYLLLLAEYLGTFLFMLVGFGIRRRREVDESIYTLIHIGLFSGVILAALVYSFGRISCHFNPAISLSFFLVGKINIYQAMFAIAMQIFGTLTAMYLFPKFIPTRLYIDWPTMPPYFTKYLTLKSFCVLETVYMFVLAYVIHSAYEYGDTQNTSESSALIVGFTFTACSLLLFDMTAFVLNPVRTLVLPKMWGTYWVWLIGPLGGSIMAGFVASVMNFGSPRRGPMGAAIRLFHMERFSVLVLLMNVIRKITQTLRMFLAEFLGTFFVMIFSVGQDLHAAVMDDHTFLAPSWVEEVALVYGFGLAAMIYTFGHISGGHFNPAITLSFLATGRISLFKAIFYVAIQMVGSIAAMYFLMRTVGAEFWYTDPIGIGLKYMVHPKFDNHGPLKKIDFARGLIIEGAGTFVLSYVMHSVSHDVRTDWGWASLSVGFTLVALNFSMYEITGCSLNPIRAFGPSYMYDFWIDHWMYWVGPITGAVLAGSVHYFFSHDEEHSRRGSIHYFIPENKKDKLSRNK